MGDPQLSGNHAGPDPMMSHLHDFMTDVVGQRSAVDKHPSELVHPALTQRGGNWRGGAEKSQTKEGKKVKKSSKTGRIPPHTFSFSLRIWIFKKKGEASRLTPGFRICPCITGKIVPIDRGKNKNSP